VTRRHGDYVYFGIAYCNTNTDVFSKKKGRKIAIDRLYQAESFMPTLDARIVIDAFGTSGYCKVEDIPTLLFFFENKVYKWQHF
jgi:hypothetical protein